MQYKYSFPAHEIGEIEFEKQNCIYKIWEKRILFIFLSFHNVIGMNCNVNVKQI